MQYIAGFNQPGYLPDSDPVDFDDFDDAQSFIVDELEHAAEIAEGSGDPDAEADCEAAKEVAEMWTATSAQSGESWGSDIRYWQTFCDGYVYWITKEE